MIILIIYKQILVSCLLKGQKRKILMDTNVIYVLYLIIIKKNIETIIKTITNNILKDTFSFQRLV